MSTLIAEYDGQTGFEDWETQGGYATLYRYGLGARGIDVMDRQAFYPSGPQQSVRVFPVYDAHGSMVATISRDGQGGFSLNDRRTFDAWGVVRSEQHGNDPRLRYCGSLGHKQDDESGLVYMRARYYEPTSGRFISEDAAMQGNNWFVYCGNEPVIGADADGHYHVTDEGYWWSGMAGGIACTVFALGIAATPSALWSSPAAKLGVISTALATAAVGFAAALSGGTDYTTGAKMCWAVLGADAALMRLVCGVASALASTEAADRDGIAGVAIAATTIQTMMLVGGLLAIETD